VRPPQGDREVFRLVPPLILWWVWVVFAVANIVDFAVQGVSARFAIVVSAILLTVTGLVYALALRPRVIAGPAGLIIVNPFRDHHVPWVAIQAVDTGDWVRVHYAPGGTTVGPAAPPSSAAGKVISCWALYVSARVKRRSYLPAPQPRSGLLRPLPASVFATPPPTSDHSRLPEEAKYLASLPTVKAIAVRLDTRADRERARPAAGNPAAGNPAPERPVTARLAWPAIAGVALPALALLIVVLA
jgi:hypothetical protein